jgi:hypothetical protein
MVYKEYLKAINLGFTAIPVIICGIIIILIALYKAYKIFKTNDLSNDYLNSIWLLGLLAFLFRLSELLIRFSDTFNAISLAKEPNISAIAYGFSELMVFPLNGLAVLIISLIFWGFLKGLLVLKKHMGVK